MRDFFYKYPTNQEEKREIKYDFPQTGKRNKKNYPFPDKKFGNYTFSLPVSLKKRDSRLSLASMTSARLISNLERISSRMFLQTVQTALAQAVVSFVDWLIMKYNLEKVETELGRTQEGNCKMKIIGELFLIIEEMNVTFCIYGDVKSAISFWRLPELPKS